MADSLGTAVLRLTTDDSALRAGLNRAQQQAAQAGGSIRSALANAGSGIKANAFTAIESGLGALPGAAGQVGSQIANIAGGLTGLGGAALAVAGISAAFVGLGVAAVGTANQMQQTINQLTVLTGSASATQAVIENLKQYALETPFDLPGLASTAKQLLAFGLNANDAVEWTKRLGDIATVTGTPVERLGINFAQIVSKGGASMVDLTQFAQAGLPIWASLEQVTGKTRAELEALPGSIPASAVVAALQQMTDAGGKFYEGGKRGATQLDTQWATLIDTLKAVALPLGQMITPLVLSGINNMISALRILQLGLEKIRDAAAAAANSGLGQLIGKAVNFATGGFLGNIANAVSGPPQATPPIPKTGPALTETLAANEAAAADLERQKALKEEEKLLSNIAVARINAQGTVAEAQARLAAQTEMNGLKGVELATAQENLKLSQAELAVKEAAAKYDQALANAKFNANDPKVIQAKAAFDEAAINLELAMVKGSQAIVAASIKAREEYDKAVASLRSVQEKNFDLLPLEQQGQVLEDAADRINEALAAGSVSLEGVLEAIPGAFVNAGSSFKEVVDGVEIPLTIPPSVDVSNADAKDVFSVAGAATDLKEANDAVAKAADALGERIVELTNKQWNVNLSVAGNASVSSSGDVLGGI
jgi:hypothetical protein